MAIAVASLAPTQIGRTRDPAPDGRQGLCRARHGEPGRLRQLRRDGHSFREDYIVVSCNPEIADLLVTVEQQYIEEMEKRLQKKIVIQSKKRFHHEKFEISERSQPNEPRPRRDDEDDGRPPHKIGADPPYQPPDEPGDEVPEEPPEEPVVASNPPEEP